MLRLRYLRESDRGCQGALRELRRLQEWRLKYGEELSVAVPADTSGSAPGTVNETAPGTSPETPPGEAPAGPQETVSRTEAAAPQVAGGSSSCNEDFGEGVRARQDGSSPIAVAIARPTAEDRPGALNKPPPD
jgi:hypothetical protein